MRDPTRDGTNERDRRAAIDLAQRLRSGDFVCLIAEQVDLEFSSWTASGKLVQYLI